MYESISLDLTVPQLRKILRNQSVRVKHGQIHKGQSVVMHRKKVRHTSSAHKRGSGAVISLDPYEMSLQGGAFLDRLKQIGSFIKDKVFSNPVYQKFAAPAIRELVQRGIDVGTAFLPPGARQPGKELAQSAASELGKVTGAFGVRKRGSYMRAHHGSGALEPVPPKGSYLNVLNASMPSSDKPNLKLVKGSDEAKAHMARLRALRGAGSIKPAGRY